MTLQELERAVSEARRRVEVLGMSDRATSVEIEEGAEELTLHIFRKGSDSSAFHNIEASLYIKIGEEDSP